VCAFDSFIEYRRVLLAVSRGEFIVDCTLIGTGARGRNGGGIAGWVVVVREGGKEGGEEVYVFLS
jgi:hypothetical protein